MVSPKLNTLDKTFKFFGDNENAAIIVATSIAVFKGIFRPLFTMMDKNSDPQTKKYAAIREGLTEIVAVPVYIAIPLLLGKAIDKSKSFANLDKAAKKMAKGSAKFIGVCVSTLLIPAVCNVIQPPIMKMIQKNGKTNVEEKPIEKKLDVTLDKQSTNNLNPVHAVKENMAQPTKSQDSTKLLPMATLNNSANAGMKVGG